MKGLAWPAALLLVACGAWQPLTPQTKTHVVARGETLSRIARQHGVTVEELKAWNALEGDLIEVDQVLVLRSDGSPSSARPPARTPRSAPLSPPPPSVVQGLPTPKARRCLPAPTAHEEDAGITAAVGLAPRDARAAVDRVMPFTADCLDGAPPRGTLQVELVVACTGLVARTRVVDHPGWPAQLIDCVVDVLEHAEFPAHDLPDGETVVQPITWAR